MILRETQWSKLHAHFMNKLGLFSHMYMQIPGWSRLLVNSKNICNKHVFNCKTLILFVNRPPYKGKFDSSWTNDDPNPIW